MGERHREEVFNTFLAACLSDRGVEADPETILQKGRVRPDVMAVFRGLRCAIEGKVADTPKAKEIVFADALKRIDQGVAHLAIAIVYPINIRSLDAAGLVDGVGSAFFDFAVLTDDTGPEWRQGGINEIAAELRRAHATIVRDDVLQSAVDVLNIGLAEVSTALLVGQGTCERLITLLGVGNQSNATPSV